MKRDLITQKIWSANDWLEMLKDDYCYECYSENCVLRGKEPKEKDSDEFMDWCIEENNYNLATDLSNIRYGEKNDQPCMIVGTVGLWNGKRTIQPVLCNSLTEAIERCIRTRYDSEATITLQDGHIDISVAHHDGCHQFEVHTLSAKGRKEIERPKYQYDGYDIQPYWLKKIYGYLF